MAEPITFYQSQAESCAKAAAEASLENQRDKFLQAQAAWQALADKTAMVQAQAAKREAERERARVD
ncbi:hypothetical protein [Novosphingobium sp. JCM 18896]|uniref:hypothetical protein n=1 Tax=Novosphingobium sp. JCM 18896 TaxID=2989731 RepID=UPI0022212FF8|nr:hypothetical protein [Novosphingobium sp. JCM 18896]MCW1430730.1 hypothetical protein [Novosphingobium sp. JCM 18896]